MIQLLPDTIAAGPSTAYDSVWAGADSEVSSTALERIMLADDKIFVVLAVVLIIWFGLMFFVLRTDKRLNDLERSVGDGIPLDPPQHRSSP